jgi:hypothetical protein
MLSVAATLVGGQSKTVVTFPNLSRSSQSLTVPVRSLSPDLLSGGLEAGYAIGIVVIFILQYPKNGTIGLNTIQVWWGNTVYIRMADYAVVPYLKVPEGGTLGPLSW